MKTQRDIRHYHSVLPREERPKQGKRYLISMNDTPAYIATISDYKGGCWASVTVDEGVGNYESLYTPGQEFDIKVSYYSFQELESDSQTQKEESSIANIG